MRLILITLAMLCFSVTAHAAATFNFITDRYWVDCCANIEPLPLSVTVTVADAAFNRGRVLAADVLHFSATSTQHIDFDVVGVPGWVFDGAMATFLGDGFLQYFFDATYDEGWSVFVRYASEFSSFEITNTMGDHESDGLGCTITDSCRVEGHWVAPIPVSEPSPLTLMVTALGVALVGRRFKAAQATRS